jgi:hypothetical protein
MYVMHDRERERERERDRERERERDSKEQHAVIYKAFLSTRGGSKLRWKQSQGTSNKGSSRMLACATSSKAIAYKVLLLLTPSFLPPPPPSVYKIMALCVYQYLIFILLPFVSAMAKKGD